jgi:tRNA(fMet)-specific endonuclease VapC
MAILIDSDVFIQAERGQFDIDAWLSSNTSEEFKIAAITVAELWHGVERASGAHRARRERFVLALCSKFEIVAYTERTAYEHARIWALLEKSGRTPGEHDMILAATALELGDGVATFNVRHFAAIRGLRVIEPQLT